MKNPSVPLDRPIPGLDTSENIKKEIVIPHFMSILTSLCRNQHSKLVQKLASLCLGLFLYFNIILILYVNLK